MEFACKLSGCAARPALLNTRQCDWLVGFSVLSISFRDIPVGALAFWANPGVIFAAWHPLMCASLATIPCYLNGSHMSLALIFLSSFHIYSVMLYMRYLARILARVDYYRSNLVRLLVECTFLIGDT